MSLPLYARAWRKPGSETSTFPVRMSISLYMLLQIFLVHLAVKWTYLYVRCHLGVYYLLYVLHVYGTRLFLLALAENVTSLGPHVNCIHTNIHDTW